MPSFQVISQLFWACRDCTEYAAWCNYPCNLSPNAGKRNPLQVAEIVLHAAILGCNLQWFQNNPYNRCRKENKVLFCAIVASPKKLPDKLQRGHATCCNLPPTCLLTPLQHRLQRKLLWRSVLRFSAIAEIF